MNTKIHKEELFLFGGLSSLLPAAAMAAAAVDGQNLR